MKTVLPIAPSLSIEHVAPRPPPIDRRVVRIAGMSVALAVVAAFVAQWFGRLIALVTNAFYFGTFSSQPVSPADNRLGVVSVLIPVIGGLLVGLMARFGSKAIRGHGIPEAMEQVLTNESRIPRRMTFLKPLSAAISIGTGGPFGAEGPIIATGGALGSWLGQVLEVTAQERKVLLSAGAAAGMAATFGSPVAAALLAVELLLFEYRPRSLIPVALATATATGIRYVLGGTAAAFAMPTLPLPGGAALLVYVAIGALAGGASTLVTRIVYAIEDGFERLPVHWMWWPAIGGLAVGLVGLASPRSLGVGYDNIEAILGGQWLTGAVFMLCVFKFIAWSIALGSGTSGGTLAPLFTFGGGLGSVVGAAVVVVAPGLGVDPRMAALVGMAAMFAGASRALLTSVVFAYETTRQSSALLPLLGGGAAAYLVAALTMRQSIMTEKISRRGVHAPDEYEADSLGRQTIATRATRQVISLSAEATVVETREIWHTSGHQGFPVLDAEGAVIGVVTRRQLDLANGDAVVRALITRSPIVITDNCTLREAADAMSRAKVGRLPVVSQTLPRRLVGIVTRSDLVEARHV